MTESFPTVDDDASQVFFDTEELFPLLNAEVIDGATEADEDQDKVKMYFVKHHNDHHQFSSHFKLSKLTEMCSISSHHLHSSKRR